LSNECNALHSKRYAPIALMATTTTLLLVFFLPRSLGASYAQVPIATLDGTPNSFVFVSSTQLYATLSSHAINSVKIDANQSKCTVAKFVGGDRGFQNGAGTRAQFSNPFGIAWDGADSLYVADFSNHLIRSISILNGTVASYVGGGNGTQEGESDGVGSNALFTFPTSVSFFSSYLYVAQKTGVRKVASGLVTTLAGGGSSASFSFLYGLAVEPSTGNVFVADQTIQPAFKMVQAPPPPFSPRKGFYLIHWGRFSLQTTVPVDAFD
jgi:hypothetical protein